MFGWVGDATGCCPGRMGLAEEEEEEESEGGTAGRASFPSQKKAPLTDLGRMSPPGHVLGPDGLLDAVHLLLVALAVAGGVLFGLLQSRLKGLDPLSRSAKAFFQFRKLTAQVCIVTYQLWGTFAIELNEA